MRRNYRKPSEDEKKLLLEEKDQVVMSARYYNDHMTNGVMDYVYKADGEIKVLPVKYSKDNFRHLTGIKEIKSSPEETFNSWVNGKFNTENYQIEPKDYTFLKLRALKRLPDMMSVKTAELDDVSGINQAKRIKFKKGLRTSNKEMMLALEDFNPHVYQPRSLLNLTVGQAKTAYDKVPENKVIAILNSEANGAGGVTIATVDVNQKYVKDAMQLTELIGAMQQQALHDKEIIQELNPDKNARGYQKMLGKDEAEKRLDELEAEAYGEDNKPTLTDEEIERRREFARRFGRER